MQPKNALFYPENGRCKNPTDVRNRRSAERSARMNSIERRSRGAIISCAQARKRSSQEPIRS